MALGVASGRTSKPGATQPVPSSPIYSHRLVKSGDLSHCGERKRLFGQASRAVASSSLGDRAFSALLCSNLFWAEFISFATSQYSQLSF